MSQQPMTSSMQSPLSIAGFYGKIPGAGDFVSRRVSQQTKFIWDEWLRHSLYASKTQFNSTANLGRSPPVAGNASWNFVLPAALCGQTLLGIIAPSVDRVGRRFPFTIFKEVGIRADGSARLEHLADFFQHHQLIIDSLTRRPINIDQLESLFAECAACGKTVSGSTLPSMRSDEFSIAPTAGSRPAADILSVLNEPADMSNYVGRQADQFRIPWPGLLLADIDSAVASYWWRDSSSGGSTRAFTHTGGLNSTLFNKLFPA